MPTTVAPRLECNGYRPVAAADVEDPRAGRHVARCSRDSLREQPAAERALHVGLVAVLCDFAIVQLALKPLRVSRAAYGPANL